MQFERFLGFIAQCTLTDARAASQALQSTLQDSAAAIFSLEGLMRTNAPQLTAGAAAALDGTAAALRDANLDTGPVGDIRSAKSNLTALLEDQWNAHAGEYDTLLLIDPAAPPVSMTSPQNPSPASIQYILRTQEIKPAESDAASQLTAPTTFWGRVKAMFRDFWSAITGWFR